MTTNTVQLHCWVCDATSTASQLRAYTLRGRGSDLCPQPVGPNPLSLLVHTCPTCGFTGDHRAFHPSQMDEQVREWVQAGGLRAAAGELGDSARERYQVAALCHARRRHPSPLQLAEYYLAASWSAQLEGAEEEAGPLQEEAASHLEQALLQGEVEDQERAVMTYLTGELRRRAGEFAAALQLFDEAAREFARYGGPRWLLRALGQQAGLAKKGSREAARLPS
jgi:hypothetical protein